MARITFKGLVTNYGEGGGGLQNRRGGGATNGGGGATKWEGGHVKFYPYERGGGETFSHAEGGGGTQKVLS